MKDRLMATVERRGKEAALALLAVAVLAAGCAEPESLNSKVNSKVRPLGGEVWLVPVDDDGGKFCLLSVFVLPRIPANGGAEVAQEYVILMDNKLGNLDGSLREMGLSLGEPVIVFMSSEGQPQSWLDYEILGVRSYHNLRYRILVEGERRIFAYAFTLRQTNCAGQVDRVRKFFGERWRVLEGMDRESRRGMRKEEIYPSTPGPGNSLPGEMLTESERMALDQGVLLRGLVKGGDVLYLSFDLSVWGSGGVPQGCKVHDATHGIRYAPQGTAVEVYNGETGRYDKRKCVYDPKSKSFRWQCEVERERGVSGSEKRSLKCGYG